MLALLAGLPEGASPPRNRCWPGCAGSVRCAGPGGTGGTDRTTTCAPGWPAGRLSEAELLGVTGRGALAAPGAGADRGARAAAPGAGARGPGRQAPRPPPHAARPRSPEPRRAGRRHRAGRPAARAAVPRTAGPRTAQADLTAVAPGPLEPELADVLGVLADVESKGGATVYRFTPGSVRRALDAGQAAADLHAFLARHSRTPVPQPLTYLIDDVGPAARAAASGRGLGVRALRRRRDAGRDPRRQAGRRPRPAPARADRAGRAGRPGGAAGGAARDGVRAGRRVRRRAMC